jgi:hypothetical protein
VNKGERLALQLVVVARLVWPEKTVSWGLVKKPVTPKELSAGPTPRINTCLDDDPEVTNPAIKMSPAPWLGATYARAERSASRAEAVLAMTVTEATEDVTDP